MDNLTPEQPRIQTPETPEERAGALQRERDAKGKFLPKTPIEFTREHFVLEVTEVVVAILIAQAIWETGVWILAR